jgi:hypothetical protein
MIDMVYAASLSSNPLFAGIMTVLVGASITVTGAVIGMFMKISSMTAVLRAMQEDLRQMAEDPDVMRWSSWAQSQVDPRSTAVKPRRRRE